ncbi:hypothetical protein AA0472_1472 [Acetobacter estunensis NRIC 0472]|nr:hypothetical protein AA0472_1472 [Acetobacter estunensis NRIC 0472]
MIIDAMDPLHTRQFSDFSLISSDSDFTCLAARIRKQGVTTYGFGDRKTPHSFTKACDVFVYFDTLEETETVADTQRFSTRRIPEKNDLNRLRKAMRASADATGWASLSVVGINLGKMKTPFTAKNFGYAKLSELIRDSGMADIEIRGAPKPCAMVRLK